MIIWMLLLLGIQSNIILELQTGILTNNVTKLTRPERVESVWIYKHDLGLVLIVQFAAAWNAFPCCSFMACVWSRWSRWMMMDDFEEDFCRFVWISLVLPAPVCYLQERWREERLGGHTEVLSGLAISSLSVFVSLSLFLSVSLCLFLSNLWKILKELTYDLVRI